MNEQILWVYWDMKYRCTKPSHKSYKNYGGRGVTVCERWMKSSRAFIEDMGPRPEGRMLERKDNNKGYSPDNCVWATRKEQNSNRRNCIYVLCKGETVTLKEACRRLGMKYRPVHKRIMARGWDTQRALSTPIGKGNSHEHS